MTPSEWLWAAIIVALLFAGTKVPQWAKNLGNGFGDGGGPTAAEVVASHPTQRGA